MGLLTESLTYRSEAESRENFRSARDAGQGIETQEVSDTNTSITTTTSASTISYSTTLTSTSEEAVTVTSMAPEPHTDTTVNGTSVPIGASTDHMEGGGSDVGRTVVAVVITVVLVVCLIAAVFFYFRRKRTSPHKSNVCFQPIRKRRSSTSDSRRTLEEVDEEPDKMVDHHDDDHARIGRAPSGGGGGGIGGSRRQLQSKRHSRTGELDTFTIEDMEDPEEDAGGRDEYYYDEVFGQSQFEDQATQNAVRQLYSTGEEQREEELLDFDFETLGIKIDDYRTDPVRGQVYS